MKSAALEVAGWYGMDDDADNLGKRLRAEDKQQHRIMRRRRPK